ncbi:unnamed protein product [Somion occarium]
MLTAATIGILLTFIFLASSLGLKQDKLSAKTAPTIHSFVPWLGSFFEFCWDAQGFLRKWRFKLGPIYRVHIVGREFVVVSHAEGIAHVMRDPQKSLTNDFNTTILEAAGDIIPQHFDQVLFGKLASLALRTFSNRNVPRLAPVFNRQLLRNFNSFSSSGGRERVSLTNFIGQSLYNSVCMSLWGPHFPIDSFADFQLIDSNISRLLSPMLFPPRKAVQARKSLKAELGKYLQRASFGDKDEVEEDVYGATEIVEIIRSSNLPSSDQQGVFLGFMFALHSNSIRMSTWFMTYLLCDTSVWARLRDEVDLAIGTEFESLEALLSAPPHRIGGDTLPLLDSALKEALRLSVAAVLMRRVTQNCELPVNDIDSVKVTEGEYIFANGCAINMEDDVFEDACSFRVDRFLKNESHKSAPVSAFGGGAHMCKGRDFAMYEMKMFAILCLKLLDISIENPDGSSAEGQSPKADYVYPTPVFFPKELFVRIQKRRDSTA